MGYWRVWTFRELVKIASKNREKMLKIFLKIYTVELHKINGSNLCLKMKYGVCINLVMNVGIKMVRNKCIYHALCLFKTGLASKRHE